MSVFSQMLILLPFHLILTSGPISLAKNHQKVVFSLWMLFKAGFRLCVLLGFFAKKTWVIPIMNPLSWLMISSKFFVLLPIKNKANNNKHVISNFIICNYKRSEI